MPSPRSPLSRIARTAGMLATAGVLAFAAPAAGEPAVELTGPPGATGAVMAIHGGGWQWTGAAQVVANRMFAGRFSGRWLTANTGYAPGGPQSLEDVLAVYDGLRAMVGPDQPICVFGASSGGHLALLVAERRDVACVISAAGPTLLEAATGTLLSLVQRAFGYDLETYAQYSPALHAQGLTAPVLLVHELEDPIVPVDQARAFLRAVPSAELVTLGPGRDEVFVHGVVSTAEAYAYYMRERAFVEASMAAWTRAHRPPIAPEPVAPTAPVTPSGPTQNRKPSKPAKPPRKAKDRRQGRGAGVGQGIRAIGASRL